MSQTSRVTTAAYTMPTEAPESDGTLDWDSTTIVVVAADVHGQRLPVALERTGLVR